MRVVSGFLALFLCAPVMARDVLAQESSSEQPAASASSPVPSFLSELFGSASQPAVAPVESTLQPVLKPQPAPVERSGARGASSPSPELSRLIARHAADHGVPTELAHRIILKESRYNPAAHHRAYWGLMQLRHDTARSVGYTGPAAGLLDADTNLRFGMAYLGNAYRTAGGDQRRALAFYSSGYYYEAKRRGLLGQMRRGTPANSPAAASAAD